MLTDQTRFERGWQKMLEVDGKAGERTFDILQDIAPDMANYIIEFVFGDVYSRPGLDAKTRELTTIAMLAALGNAPTQLKVHIHAVLNNGGTRHEVIEVLIHALLYAGFPASLNALMIAKDVFAKRDEQGLD